MSTSRTRTRRLAALTGITALALAGAVSTPAHAAAKTLTYDCKALGGGVDAGQWTVALDVDLPETVTAGSTMPAPKVTAKVTTSDDAANLLRDVLKADKVSGTGTTTYTIDDTSFNAMLTVPQTQVPDTGAVTVDSTGEGQSAEAPSAPTTSTVTAGDFKADLTVTKADGSTQAVDVACTLPSGADATLGTIQVVADDDATPTDPTTSTAQAPTSSTAAPTSSTTAAATTSEVTGPPVQTGVVGDGANSETVALGLLALGGVVSAGLASRRRLNR